MASLRAGQVAASSVAGTNRCPLCGSDRDLLLEFTARRTFLRPVTNQETGDEQYQSEVSEVLESITCGACAAYLQVLPDADFEVRKALLAAQRELASQKAFAKSELPGEAVQ
jgi:ribosomal protein S14